MTTEEIRLVIPAEEDFRPIAHLVSLSAQDGVLHATLGPFPPDKVHEVGSDGELDLQRVLDTVCDTHEVEERDGGAWVELTKRIAAAGTAA